jgi:beta-lactamase superfamily II metal-dependent hydrolase
MHRRVIVLFLGAAALGCGAMAQHDTAPERLELTFFDVGQGDAMLIRSPEGKTALVDAGPGDLAAQLHRLGVDTIDLAVASHAHADHIGGMAEVIDRFPVRYYLDNGMPHTTSTYRRLMELVRERDLTYLRAEPRALRLGSATIRVLPPDPGAEEQNDGSVGLVVEFGTFRALLTGDAETGALAHFVRLGVPQVTILKAAHHGSRNGVSPAWLAATRPQIVVISCGRENPYGHPHAWALRYYGGAGAEIYRTDRDGTITVLADGEGTYEVLTTTAN